MRYNVSIVNHSVPLRDIRGYKVGKSLITDSRFSKGVELVELPKEVMDVKSSKGGQS